MQEDHESSENISEAIKRSRAHWTTLDFACPRCGSPVEGSMAPPTAKTKAIYLTCCACQLPVFTEEPIETPDEWQAICREIVREQLIDKLTDPSLPTWETDSEMTEEERAIRKRILDRLRNPEEERTAREMKNRNPKKFVEKGIKALGRAANRHQVSLLEFLGALELVKGPLQEWDAIEQR